MVSSVQFMNINKVLRVSAEFYKIRHKLLRIVSFSLSVDHCLQQNEAHCVKLRCVLIQVTIKFWWKTNLLGCWPVVLHGASTGVHLPLWFDALSQCTGPLHVDHITFVKVNPSIYIISVMLWNQSWALWNKVLAFCPNLHLCYVLR